MTPIFAVIESDLCTEISSNNRAGCQATHCKNAEGGPIKIQKGEIRQGVSVTINEHTSMKYRHW